MAIEAFTTNQHFHEALVKLVNNFWGKPRIAALLRAMINRVQELEDATWEVLEAYHIDTADSARLDILGKIVGQNRFAFSDEEYRAVLRAKIASNKSRGLTDDLISVIHLATAGTMPVDIEHYVPATATVTLGEEITDAQLTALEYLLPRTRAAGVKLHLFRRVSDEPFIVGSSVDAALGSDIDSSVTPGTSDATLYSTRTL